MYVPNLSGSKWKSWGYLRARFIAHQSKPAGCTVAAVQVEIAVSAVEARITRQLAVFAERSGQTFCRAAKRKRTSEITSCECIQLHRTTSLKHTTLARYIHLYSGLYMMYYQTFVLSVYSTLGIVAGLCCRDLDTFCYSRSNVTCRTGHFHHILRITNKTFVHYALSRSNCKKYSRARYELSSSVVFMSTIYPSSVNNKLYCFWMDTLFLWHFSTKAKIIPRSWRSGFTLCSPNFRSPII